MSLPEQVKVGAYVYDVSECDRVIAVDGLLGQADYINLSIRITSDAPEPRQRVTLIHELLHAIAEHAGIDPTGEDEQIEHHIRAMAPAIVELLRRNPELVAYVTKGSSDADAQ